MKFLIYMFSLVALLLIIFLIINTKKEIEAENKRICSTVISEKESILYSYIGQSIDLNVKSSEKFLYICNSDTCEYNVWNSTCGSKFLHNPSCKYCKKRTLKIIKEYFKEK